MKNTISTAAGIRAGLPVGLLLLILAGCARVPARPATTLPPLPPLSTADAVHYSVDAQDSRIVFLVYRAGPLASFGHNHVIRATAFSGNVYLNKQFAQSGFALTLPVRDFRVDEPAERAAEGADFASQPSAQAISGTKSNMLGPALLDAAHFPVVNIRSAQVAGSPDKPVMTVRITLHGAQHQFKVPVTLTVSAHGVTADGSFAIQQTDFGLSPFSILGGGLQVANQVKVKFHIVATRI